MRMKALSIALGLAAMLAGCAQAPATTDTPAPGPNDVTKAGVDMSSCSRPVYPPLALANKVEGTSTIGFLVGPDGKVHGSRLYQSSGDATLDEAARSAIAQCTFAPARYKGKPVRTWIPVMYVWKAD